MVPLAEYDLVVADMTDLNPNVMYEVGLVHGMNTPIIMITQDVEGLPFDLRSYRALDYSPVVGKFDAFVAAFEARLAEIPEVSFGSQ